MKINVNAFETLPTNLPPSAYVDFFLFLAGLKPALRIVLNNISQSKQIIAWCSRNNFSCAADTDGFTCIAHSEKYAKLLQELDNSLNQHEYELGIALGYPICCCKAISLIGENNIDNWEKDFITKSDFAGGFKFIDISEYANGSSLISHIPCSDKCENSLRIAEQAHAIIAQNQTSPYFHRWKNWFN